MEALLGGGMDHAGVFDEEKIGGVGKVEGGSGDGGMVGDGLGLGI